LNHNINKIFKHQFNFKIILHFLIIYIYFCINKIPHFNHKNLIIINLQTKHNNFAYQLVDFFIVTYFKLFDHFLL